MQARENLGMLNWRAVQRSVLCRSRRELSSECLLAKVGFDTAENEPFKVCPIEPALQAAPWHGCFRPGGMQPTTLPLWQLSWLTRTGRLFHSEQLVGAERIDLGVMRLISNLKINVLFSGNFHILRKLSTKTIIRRKHEFH